MSILILNEIILYYLPRLVMSHERHVAISGGGGDGDWDGDGDGDRSVEQGRECTFSLLDASLHLY